MDNINTAIQVEKIISLCKYNLLFICTFLSLNVFGISATFKGKLFYFVLYNMGAMANLSAVRHLSGNSHTGKILNLPGVIS